MKNFHDYYFGLPVSERADYCQRAGTTVNYAERLAGGFRLPSLRMAKRLIAASKNKVTFQGLIAPYEKRHGPL